MKFIQQEGHALQPDTMMPPEVRSITDPDIWKVSIHQNKKGTFLKYNIHIIKYNCNTAILLCSVLLCTYIATWYMKELNYITQN